MTPAFDLCLQSVFVPDWRGSREPLITIGHSHYAYFLYAERRLGMLRLVSQSEGSIMEYEMADPRARPLAIEMTYSPESRRVAVAVDGNKVLPHPVTMWTTPPTQAP